MKPSMVVSKSKYRPKRFRIAEARAALLRIALKVWGCVPPAKMLFKGNVQFVSSKDLWEGSVRYYVGRNSIDQMAEDKAGLQDMICAVCAENYTMRSMFGWPRGIHPCECRKWHTVCDGCAVRHRMIPKKYISDAEYGGILSVGISADRGHFVRLLVCPEYLKTALRLMKP